MIDVSRKIVKGDGKMRLLTRSDFDGLVCSVLLKEVGIIDEYRFVHPKDMQDGRIFVTENDVLANIPFMPGCGLWFDHHVSEAEVQSTFMFEYKGASKPAKSCARVIFDYYGGVEKFPRFAEMMEAVDKCDSADLTTDEILSPKGWILLSFIMDPRTGLGRYKDYRISNYQLMEDMIDHCLTKTIEEIMEMEDVKERIERYFEQQELYKEMIKDNARAYDNVLVIDLRRLNEIVTGNRFIEYCMYPEQNISIRVMWGMNRQNIVFAVGHSIINRTCMANVGELMFKYHGGGHQKVGTCQVAVEKADVVLEDLIAQTKGQTAATMS